MDSEPSMGHNTLRERGPVVIGGVGGSGTRVITEMLIDMGYHMGTETNSAHDNLWFRFLLKRPGWVARHADESRETIFRGMRIMADVMTGPYRPSLGDLGFILRAAVDSRKRGLKRMVKLLRPKAVDYSDFVGWGWKEPNSHILLELLNEYFERLRFIHVIRHGLDMAYSRTRGQLFEWGPFLGVRVPGEAELIPPAFLDFWLKANRRAIESGRRMGPERFMLVRFDEMCTSPGNTVERLVNFLGLGAERIDIEKYSKRVNEPESIGRYRQHDVTVFTPEQIDAVRALGFVVEV